MSLHAFQKHNKKDVLISNGIKLLNSCEDKTLGVIIDKELKFEPYIRICVKTSPEIRSTK